MRKLRFLWLFAALATLCGAVIAQRSADKYVISAQAGGINFVTGEVSRVGVRAGHVRKGDSIGVGDRVVTKQDGRVEVLMNPGSFIRLGSNSEFSFESTSLDDLRTSLYRGSAIFEVYATDRFVVRVTTPTGAVAIAKSGVYRFDLDEGGNGTLSVIKGKAQIVGKPDYIKEGRQQQIGSEAVAVKFDKKVKADELSIWSRDRSKDLAKVTSSLSARVLNDTLLSSFRGGGFGLWDSFGVWVFDPMRSGYCFLPFGWGWRSPYGFGFGSGIDWWSLQRLTYNPYFFPRGYPRIPVNPSAGPVASAPVGAGSQVVAPSAPAPQPRTMPPFADIQRQQKIDPDFDAANGGFRRGGGDDRSIVNSNPSIGMPSQSNSPMAMPSAGMPSAPAMPAQSRGGGQKTKPIDD